MTTTETSSNDNIASLRLFQVTFADWGEPVSVIANAFRQAAEIAIGDCGADHDTHSTTVWDASDHWKGLFSLVHAHTMEALQRGCVGIVVYDEEQGWLALPDESDR